MEDNASRKTRKGQLVIFIILVLPFLLNDLSNIYVRNYLLWLSIDYLFVKILPIAVISFCLVKGKLTFADLGLNKIDAPRFLVYTIALTILGIAIDQIGWRFFDKMLPGEGLGGIPKVNPSFLINVNLYFGLVIVGIVEEAIFRGLCFSVLRKYNFNIGGMFFLSPLIFGLIHWSFGLHVIINTALIGLLFTFSLWKTKSIFPAIFAHYFINFAAFSGIIPYDSKWFALLGLN